jgi:hypothetical protein
MTKTFEVLHAVSKTPCFEDAISNEMDLYYVCSNARCARVFRFGDPLHCAFCGSQTVRAATPENPHQHHGTYYSYIKLRCRCERCREANREYRNNYRRGRREAATDRTVTRGMR